MSDLDGAACNAALLAADALTRHAVGAGSEHFDPFIGASGVELSALWSDVYDRIVTCMIATSASTLGAVLTNAMVVDALSGFALLYLLSFPGSDRCSCGMGFRFRTAGVLSVLQMSRQGRGWMRCLQFLIAFLVMVMLFRVFETCLVCVQLL